MTADLAPLYNEIHTLLEAPPSGESAPGLRQLEDTLTSGYANALALEAMQARLSHEINELAGNLDVERRSERLAILALELRDVDEGLRDLRSVLAPLRARVTELRTAAA